MSEYTVQSDGTITDPQTRRSIAFLDTDGKTVKADKFGRVLAYIEDDGTIKSDRYGTVLGFLEPDGTVKSDRYGRVLGKVSPPHLTVQAALFLIR